MVTTPFLKKTLLTYKKVTTSEQVDKGTTHLGGIKEAVVTILKEDLDNFQGQSKGSTDWFNLDHDFLRESFYT